jgi:hypothetical protein
MSLKRVWAAVSVLKLPTIVLAAGGWLATIVTPTFAPTDVPDVTSRLASKQKSSVVSILLAGHSDDGGRRKAMHCTLEYVMNYINNYQFIDTDKINCSKRTDSAAIRLIVNLVNRGVKVVAHDRELANGQSLWKNFVTRTSFIGI